MKGKLLWILSLCNFFGILSEAAIMTKAIYWTFYNFVKVDSGWYPNYHHFISYWMINAGHNGLRRDIEMWEECYCKLVVYFTLCKVCIRLRMLYNLGISNHGGNKNDKKGFLFDLWRPSMNMCVQICFVIPSMILEAYRRIPFHRIAIHVT